MNHRDILVKFIAVHDKITFPALTTRLPLPLYCYDKIAANYISFELVNTLS